MDWRPWRSPEWAGLAASIPLAQLVSGINLVVSKCSPVDPVEKKEIAIAGSLRQ